MSDVVALFVVLLIFYSIAAVRPQTFPSSVAGLLLGRALPLLRLRELLASAAGLTGRACAVDLPHGDVAGREGGAARAGRPGGGRVRRRRWRSDGQRRHHIIVESSRLSARGAAGGCCRALLRPAARWGGGGRAGERVRRPRVAPRRQNERRLVSEMALELLVDAALCVPWARGRSFTAEHSQGKEGAFSARGLPRASHARNLAWRTRSGHSDGNQWGRRATCLGRCSPKKAHVLRALLIVSPSQAPSRWP